MKKKMYGRSALAAALAAGCIVGFSVSQAIEAIKPEPDDAPEVVTQEQVVPQTQVQTTNPIETPVEKPDVKYYTDTDAVMLARLVYGESRGVQSVTEQACVIWTVLNRVDANYNNNGGIEGQVTAQKQFHYISSNPTIDDHGRDLYSLALDVLERWNREKNGEMEVGRILPSDYMWFRGDGKHNHFRNQDKGGVVWDYQYDSPYEN